MTRRTTGATVVAIALAAAIGAPAGAAAAGGSEAAAEAAAGGPAVPSAAVRAAASSAAASGTLTASGQPAPSAAAARARPRLRAFQSCSALVRYAARHTKSVPPVARIPFGPTTTPAPEAQSAPGTGDAPSDSSATNVQEAGVDEPDIVKTDGTTLFAVAGSTLYAVDARAATPRIVGSLRLPDGGGHELLLHDGRALVISEGPRSVVPLPVALERSGRAARAAGAGARASMVAPDMMPAGPPTTILTELDVRDPAAMRVTRTLSFEATPVSARLTGATARVVVSSSPPYYAQPAARRKLAGWIPRATLARGRGSSGAHRRGDTRRRRGARAAGRTRSLVGCRQVRRLAAFSGGGLLTVLTIDLARGLPAIDADALMTDAQTVYASPASLYVATQRWNPTADSSTTIHRFDASQPGRTDYRASGTVPGHLLSQFALSEHDGVLRAATTTEGGGDTTRSESFVTTLSAGDGSLHRLGQVGGLGRGEEIRAVRFLGPTCYVVTFRQTDPLYTVDLSDPAQPRVTGELKILGYSAYLHPLGDGLLLGVGQDATAEGRLKGAQLSLFDVSDPARPRRLQQRDLGENATSEAEWDHHAFLWWPATKLAVMPLSGGEVGSDGSGSAVAAGFRVDRDAIAEVGRVTRHAAAVRRAVVVGERLFTLSDDGVQASALSTLAPQTWLPFPAPATGG
ncbi:beta-propeller domain-containing protein [Conexibacter woesei]|uniref:Beta propeller domain protein n=1 Tax=Conexibacter woesei (strain DSM 14684 / CCUG 47730 / CIP 108061 / JCM 11494 / NBRC 100937 / ID131577) TaxID=469383 RepID=D3FAZ0_CONWI|nr:beta-propeller domain-containing protein [Conexibacter woesei]ADB51303.1 Beta propeller domain protein [Conexibacter woesei DSM 14684]